MRRVPSVLDAVTSNIRQSLDGGAQARHEVGKWSRRGGAKPAH